MFKSIMLFVIVLLLIIAIPLLIFFISTNVGEEEDEKPVEDNTFTQGLQYFIVDDYKNADEYMKNTLLKDKKNYFAYYIRGVIEKEEGSIYEKKDRDAVIANLGKAIHLKPDFVKCRNELADYLFRILWLKLINALPRNKSNGSGLAVPNNLEKKEIIAEIDRILEIDNTYHKAYYLRAVSKTIRATDDMGFFIEPSSIELDSTQHVDDLDDYDKAIQYAPTPGIAEYYLARAVSRQYLHQDYAGAAKDYFSYIIQNDSEARYVWTVNIPEYEARYRAGVCYFKLGDDIKAHRIFNKALAVCKTGYYSELEEKINEIISRMPYHETDDDSDD